MYFFSNLAAEFDHNCSKNECSVFVGLVGTQYFSCTQKRCVKIPLNCWYKYWHLICCTSKHCSSNFCKFLIAKGQGHDLSCLTHEFEEIAWKYFNRTHFILLSSHLQNFIGDDNIRQQPRQWSKEKPFSFQTKRGKEHCVGEWNFRAAAPLRAC